MATIAIARSHKMMFSRSTFFCQKQRSYSLASSVVSTGKLTKVHQLDHQQHSVSYLQLSVKIGIYVSHELISIHHFADFSC